MKHQRLSSFLTIPKTDDDPQQKQQKKWSRWTLKLSGRNQRTGGGRGQIARHTARRVQADADSARPSLLMDASPFGVSMCNALIFFFLLSRARDRTARCS